VDAATRERGQASWAGLENLLEKSKGAKGASFCTHGIGTLAGQKLASTAINPELIGMVRNAMLGRVPC
jgi:hypothetical protein